MPQRFHLTLADPALARGPDATLSFSAQGADALAQQLQDALRTPALFDAWRRTQEDPDAVDPALGVVDPAASVSGKQRDLKIDLIVVTTLPGTILRQRMRLLAGSGWALHDVSAV